MQGVESEDTVDSLPGSSVVEPSGEAVAVQEGVPEYHVTWATTAAVIGTTLEDHSTAWFNPCVDYSAMYKDHSRILNFRFPPLEWSWFDYRDTYVKYCNNKATWRECAFIGKPNLCYCPEYIFKKKESLYSHENSYLYTGKTSSNPDDTFEKDIAFGDLNTLEEIYRADLRDLFGDSDTDFENIEEYHACESVLSTYKRKTLKAIEQLYAWFEGMFDLTYKYKDNPLYLDDFISMISEMTNSVLSVGLVGGYDTFFETIQACVWPTKYSYHHTEANTNAEEKAKFDTYSSYGQTALQEYMTLKLLFDKMAESYGSLRDHYLNTLKPQLMLLQQYTKHSITKKAIADHFTSVEYENAHEEFFGLAEEFVDAANEFHESLYEITFRLEEAYNNLYSLTLPILDDVTLNATNVWQKLVMETLNHEMLTLQSEYKSDRKMTFKEMLSNMFEPFLQYPKKIKTQIQAAVSGFQLAFAELNENLETYKAGSKMEANFFM